MDEILWWLFEILFEFVGEMFCEVLRAVFGGVEPSTWETVWSTFLLFVAGAFLGLVSSVVLPDRLLPRPRMPGLSLVLGPLVSGSVMHAWGSWRRDRGHATSTFATFHGGAAFALGAALGRFVVVAV